ncbi:MAG: diacylglycerol kinase family lipid kinase [Gemmatimonadota bacterium]|jgi:YegS/Rv2252/BmrU family lipid kinase|nr:diacylglycerol kinase family lipid kinase [Gemmatimonadota bacterium]
MTRQLNTVPVGNEDRTLVILNPAAGQGDSKRMRGRIGGAFAVLGASIDIVETAAGGDAELFSRQAVEAGYRSVAVCGGDGTIAEVVTGLAGTGVPFGIIPIGTANLVAANLGLPSSVEKAVEVIVAGRSVPMDVGQLDNGRYFALIAGAGWDAEVMRSATRELKDRLGFAAYLVAGLRRVATPPSARFRLTVDGEEIEVRAATVLVANFGRIFHSVLPLDFEIAPDTSTSDGKFDVCIFAPRNLSDVATVLWKVTSKRYIGDQRMIYFQAREIRIEAEPPVITQVDGDVAGPTPLVARVVAGGVSVLVP